MKTVVTITLEHEYGHSGNRPSQATVRREITAAIERAMKLASSRRMEEAFSKDSELAGWSFSAIKVEQP